MLNNEQHNKLYMTTANKVLMITTIEDNNEYEPRTMAIFVVQTGNCGLRMIEQTCFRRLHNDKSW